MKSIPIKTQQEIEIMKEGAEILKHVLSKMSEEVRVGVSTYELNIIAENIIRKNGAIPAFKGYKGFPAALCTSVNDEVVHGIPKKDKVLREGDIIGIDCGVLYKGFITDACSTFIVGNVSSEIEAFVNTTKDALDQAVKQVRSGGFIGDISDVIQKTIEKQDYSPVVDCTGHGVGRELHEPPEIFNKGKRGTGAMMKAGMTLAIEPISIMGSGKIITKNDKWTIVSEDGTPSAHFEHTVLVTDDGYEILV